jgi:hypothetical protein
VAYVQVDLKALPRAEGAAGLLGVPMPELMGGLVRLWAFAYGEKQRVVSNNQLAGLVGVQKPNLIEALEAFGFVEPVEGGLRIRGTKRYERIHDARVAGGKARQSAKLQLSSSSAPAQVELSSNQPSDLRSEIREKDLESKTLSAGADAAPPVEALREVWNARAKAVGLPEWRETGRRRAVAAKARVRERPDLDEWRAIVARIMASSFCRGQNDRAWVATADWLLQPETAAKVLEGKYDDRTKAPSKPPSVFEDYPHHSGQDEGPRCAIGGCELYLGHSGDHFSEAMTA